jgi:glycosyltransferase 2 family protein
MADAQEILTELGAEPPRVTFHVLRVVPMLIVLGLLVHFLLPRIGTIEGSLETLRTMKPWAIALAFAFEALSYVANGMVLQSVVALTGERMSLRRATAIEIGAGTVALVAAGTLGFAAAIYKWSTNSGLSQRAAMLVSWLPSLFDSASLILFALTGAVELLLLHELSRTILIALAIVVWVLAMIIAAVIVLLVRNDWLTALTTFASRVMRRISPSGDDSLFIDAAHKAAQTWRSLRRGGWLRPACSSLLVLTFDFLCLRYAFLAAGLHPHITLLIAVYGVPLLLGRASLIPGGIAVTEVAMAALIGGLGVAASAAVVVVLVYRLISFWLPAVVGIPIAVALQSRRSD